MQQKKRAARFPDMKYTAQIQVFADDGQMVVETSFDKMPAEEVVKLATRLQGDLAIIRYRAEKKIFAQPEKPGT
jgi:hypothetical protein